MIEKITISGLKIQLDTETRVWRLSGYYKGWLRRFFPEKRAKSTIRYLIKEGFMQHGDTFLLMHSGK